jgi:hypothetical protein
MDGFSKNQPTNKENRMNTVRVSVKMTSNIPSQTDLFVEVDDISKPSWRPLAAFASIKAAAKWLQEEGYRYVVGTNGVYSRDTATARKNAPAEYRHVDGGGRTNEAGFDQGEQQATGVRRLAVKLGRMGATLRPGPGSVAGN